MCGGGGGGGGQGEGLGLGLGEDVGDNGEPGRAGGQRGTGNVEHGDTPRGWGSGGGSVSISGVLGDCRPQMTVGGVGGCGFLWSRGTLQRAGTGAGQAFVGNTLLLCAVD